MLCGTMKILSRCYLGISIILLLCFCFSSCSGKQGEPQLELSLQKLDPTTKEIILQLVVTNVEEHRLVIPHLRGEILKQYWRWGGWVYLVQEKNHDGFFKYSDDLSAHFTKKDLISLAPGEHFVVTINIAEMKWMSPYKKDPHPELVEFKGEYEIKFEFGLSVEDIPFLLVNTVWTGWRESNTVTFVIPHKIQDQASQKDTQDTQQADRQDTQQ